MKYDFTSIIDRKGKDALAVDILPNMLGPGKKVEVREGLDYIPMWVADMNFPALPKITEAIIERAKHPTYGYFITRDEYYNSIIKWHEERNHVTGLKKEHIGYENGVLGGVASALHAVCSQGDNVLVHAPTYIGFTGTLNNNGYHIIHSPLKKDEEGIWRMDFEDMDAKIKANHIHVAIFCSPHNPCGRVWTREELEHIGRICLENNVVLFSDEIHSDLILPGYHHTPIGSLSDELAQNTLTAISPSKTFSLAGLQTSSVIVPNEALRKAFDEELKRHDGNPKCNILGLEACRIAYTEGDEWLDQLISILEENRRLIVEYLRREFPSVIVSPLEGTYLLWMDFRPLDIPADKLAELLRREAFLFFDDGIVFGEAGRGFERWNLACPTSYITPALERLGKALRAHADKR